MNIFDTHEGIRLKMTRQEIGHWNRWGPFLAERAWGTVREDYSADGDAWNYFRFQISPEIVFALGMMAITPGHEKTGECVETEASRHPAPDEMDAYERLLGDAMRGDPTLFAREDSVEEAWRIVDPVLNSNTPVYEYEPGTWGPKEVDQTVCPPGGWHNPCTSPN